MIGELVRRLRVKSLRVKRDHIGLAGIEDHLVAEIDQIAGGGRTCSHPGERLSGLFRVNGVREPSAGGPNGEATNGYEQLKFFRGIAVALRSGQTEVWRIPTEGWSACCWNPRGAT